ncbi:hypothetical protein [Streptomyces sp. NBC_01465]|uniref:hypothetical protein n=1 Tax=Streptomyces sp. NBC_01465 TaxID=2903878 RepID=UPI002E37C782|nr:hypothetical protein [Streptomyces sp. NBC_01465]
MYTRKAITTLVLTGSLVLGAPAASYAVARTGVTQSAQVKAPSQQQTLHRSAVTTATASEAVSKLKLKKKKKKKSSSGIGWIVILLIVVIIAAVIVYAISRSRRRD